MGKSLYVQRMAEKLKLCLNSSINCVLVTIPIHGSAVTNDTMLDFFAQYMAQPTCCIYHIDVSSSVLRLNFNQLICYYNMYFLSLI